MTLLTQTEGLMILLIFGIAMLALTWFQTKTAQNSDAFLVASREVPMWRGAFSIAVSWIWAPAIFICALQSYTKGLPGIFWFVAPNILCFFVFAPLALRLRNLMPKGYTLPEFIYERYQDKKTHIAFLCVFFLYQLGAVVINCVAGGALLSLLCNIDVRVSILLMSLIALSYSLLSGLKASILTDLVQMSLVLLIAFVLVPMVISNLGGFSVVSGGLAGKDGLHGNMFDPKIAYAMGIPMTFGLLAGPINDQMFFQRTMAVKRKDIVKTFVYGGLLFGLVPIILSLFGFIAANPEIASQITVKDPQLVGAVVVGAFLPKWALFLFALMAFAGLASTLDSAYCALSSLGATDIYRRYFNPNPEPGETLKAARKTMIAVAVVGTGIALLQPKLLWVFLIYGATASAGMFPIILTLYWKRLTKRGAFWGVVLSLIFGGALSVYANVKEDTDLIVLAAVLSVGIGLVVCLVDGFMNKDKLWEPTFPNLEDED